MEERKIDNEKGKGSRYSNECKDEEKGRRWKGEMKDSTNEVGRRK